MGTSYRFEDLRVEICVSLVCDWLPFSAIVRLDIAFCNKVRRPKFHELLRATGNVFDAQPIFDKIRLISQEQIYQFYKYVQSRKLKMRSLPVTNELRSDLLTNLVAVTGKTITRIKVYHPHSELAPRETHYRKVHLEGPFKDLMPLVPNLRELALVDCDMSHGSCLDGIHCPKLKRLWLNCVGARNANDRSVVAALLRLGGPSLLSFQASNLRSKIPFKLMGGICPNLCSVSLTDCFNAQQLVVLMTQCQSIRHVELCHFFTRGGADPVAALTCLPAGSLLTLHLDSMFRDSNASALTDTDLAKLGAHHGSSLTTLWIAQCSNFSAAALTLFLQVCTNLTTLYLTPSIDAQLNVALIEAIGNSSIRYLYINHAIKDQIAHAILRYGHKLLGLGLHMPAYSTGFAADVLCNVRSLRTLYVSSTTPANVAKVLSWRNDSKTKTMKIVDHLPGFDFDLCI